MNKCGLDQRESKSAPPLNSSDKFSYYTVVSHDEFSYKLSFDWTRRRKLFEEGKGNKV